jgi:hypothetical protein
MPVLSDAGPGECCAWGTFYNLPSLSFVRLERTGLFVSAARRQRCERQIGIYHLASPGGWWRRSSRRLAEWGERSHVARASD